jgi:DNA-directed RNA polymerase specialized sigma24 family protein
VPFEVALVETAGPPLYQRIARKALQLRELGLSDRVIAERLGSTDKTVANAIHWLREIARERERNETGS